MVFKLTNESPNVFPQTKLSEHIGVKIIDTNKWLKDVFKYSNIFVTFFSPKYGDSSDSGEFGDFFLIMQN